MSEPPSIERMRHYFTVNYGEYRREPKLTHEERCGAFAYLLMGARPFLVKEMFNLSRQSVSYLAGRMPDQKGVSITIDNPGYDPKNKHSKPVYTDTIGGRDSGKARDPDRKLRYQDVLDEYGMLGEDKFVRKYGFTTEIVEREQAAKARIMARKQEKNR